MQPPPKPAAPAPAGAPSPGPCGCPGCCPSPASCSAFLADRRNQSSALLCAAFYLLLVIIPLYPLSFAAFSVALFLVCLLFVAGLAYDGLLISSTLEQASGVVFFRLRLFSGGLRRLTPRPRRRQAKAVRPVLPSVADALTARISWRWRATLLTNAQAHPACESQLSHAPLPPLRNRRVILALNALGGGAMLAGCGFYLQAAFLHPPSAAAASAAGPGSTLAGPRDVFLGNVLFAWSFAFYIPAFALLAFETVLTASDVCRATGAPEPGACDEGRALLFSFLASLGLLGVSSALLAAGGGSRALSEAALAFGLLGTVAGIACSSYMVHMQWRDFHAKQGVFTDYAALAVGGGPGGAGWGSSGHLDDGVGGVGFGFPEGGGSGEAGMRTPLAGSRRGRAPTPMAGGAAGRGVGEEGACCSCFGGKGGGGAARGAARRGGGAAGAQERGVSAQQPQQGAP